MTFSRRQFLEAMGLGIGASVVGGRFFAGFTSALAQGAALPTPVDLGERSGNEVSFRLEAKKQVLEIAGRRVALLTYNGSFPGPTLRMREGDGVRVEFTNGLSEETNLHFHGLHVPITQPNSETPFRRAAPGERIIYEFPIPEGSAGTYWYHPHVHGSVAPQLFGGLAGAIIVEGPPDAVFAGVPEQLVMLKDFEFRSGKVPEHSRMEWMMGREGDLLTVNGALLPHIALPGGEVRLRLINASNARYYPLTLPGATLTIIGTDGGYVATPYPADELLMAPGERYDVIARFDQAGTHELLTLPYDRAAREMMGMGSNAASGGMGGMHAGPSGMGGMHMGGQGMGMMSTGVNAPTPLLKVEAASSSRYQMPSDLRPIQALSPADASVRRRIVLTETMMRLEFLIDGKAFDANRVDFAPTLGTVEHWQLVNEAGMDHPMHLHVFPFQVYAKNGMPVNDPAWKDVVNVPAKETVEILIPFVDFEGRTVFHCHIVEHEDLGMMSVVEVRAPR